MTKLSGLLCRPELAPSSLYRVMLDCWAAEPPHRPRFRELTDTLGDLLGQQYRDCLLQLDTQFQQAGAAGSEVTATNTHCNLSLSSPNRVCCGALSSSIKLIKLLYMSGCCWTVCAAVARLGRPGLQRAHHAVGPGGRSYCGHGGVRGAKSDATSARGGGAGIELEKSLLCDAE